jgi:hypothetical protein
MIVEDGEIRYAIENKLAHKLDLMADMCTREKGIQNAYLANEGRTGSGKTNTSLVEAHYFKTKTGRDIHMFFRLEGLINFLKTTEKKIVIWDEPSLDSFSTDQLTSLNKNLLRLINTGRKKRHFVIVNLTKFWRFPEDLVVDTCLGMVHTFVKNDSTYGRFFYIRQKFLEALWEAKKKSNKRLYSKLSSFGGNFPYIMEKHMDRMNITIEGHPNCTYKDYERLKDEAIATIGVENTNKRGMGGGARDPKVRLEKLQYKLSQIKAIPQQDLAIMLEIDPKFLRDWAKMPLKPSFA